MVNNCLQISDTDIVGSRFNGYNLMQYLHKRGIACNYYVQQKESDHDSVSDFFSFKNTAYPTAYNSANNLNNNFSTRSFYHALSYELLFDRRFLEADIIHLHLLHNLPFNLSDLPLVSTLKSVVWTLHDPWALTGHCVHPGDCERWKTGCDQCPDLKRHFSVSADNASLNWIKKKKVYQSSELDIIVASRWMYDKVSNSPLFEHNNIHLVPFGVDLSIFKPTDSKKIKENLGIPEDNIVLGFRAQEGPWKGLEYIKACLRLIEDSSKITLLIFYQTGLLDEFQNKFQIVELGWIATDNEMSDAYNATDIFLMPSAAESFGMMAMEAMCCGKTVIGMSGTALEETIMAERGAGVVVPQGDIDAMFQQLDSLIKNKYRRIEIENNAYAVSRKFYGKERYLDKIIDIYEKALVGKKKSGQFFIKKELERINNVEFEEKKQKQSKKRPY